MLQVLATHSLFAPSADPSGYRLQLTLDVPSASTGTGGALLLDGRDVAMVRCAIVDSHANDALVATATNRITWAVTAGKGDPRRITPVILALFPPPKHREQPVHCAAQGPGALALLVEPSPKLAVTVVVPVLVC